MNFIRILHDALCDLWKHRTLATVLAIRDTKARYRSSLLGLFWAVFPPIAAAVGLAAAKGAGVVSFGNTSIPYPAYVIFGMSLWQLFTSAITKPIAAFAASRGLLTKVYFPREVIILSEISKLAVFLIVQAILVTAVFMYFKVSVNFSSIYIILPLLLLVILGLTISLLLTPIALLFGDINNALPFIVGALFFITPVVYTAPPEGGLFSFVVHLNPITPLFEISRDFLYGSGPFAWQNFWIVTGVVLPSACVALVFFRLAMPIVIERWSS